MAHQRNITLQIHLAPLPGDEEVFGDTPAEFCRAYPGGQALRKWRRMSVLESLPPILPKHEDLSRGFNYLITFSAQNNLHDSTNGRASIAPPDTDAWKQAEIIFKDPDFGVNDVVQGKGVLKMYFMGEEEVETECGDPVEEKDVPIQSIEVGEDKDVPIQSTEVAEERDVPTNSIEDAEEESPGADSS